MPSIEDDIADAISTLRTHVRWKPGQDIRHLEKRKRRGHLPAGADLSDYENLIVGVLSDDDSKVHRYDVADEIYGVVWGTRGNQEWLVIFGLNGVMETAFPNKAPKRYIARRAMTFLGKIEDI